MVDSTVKSSTSNQAAKSQDNGLPSVSKTPSKNKLSPCDDSLTSVTPSKTKQSPNFEKQNFMPSPQPHSFTNYESPGKPRWTSNSWHALDCESKQGKCWFFNVCILYKIILLVVKCIIARVCVAIF